MESHYKRNFEGLSNFCARGLDVCIWTELLRSDRPFALGAPSRVPTGDSGDALFKEKEMAKKKPPGRTLPGGYELERAQPTLSVIANTIGVKRFTTVFGMGTGVAPSL